ncbi:MAG: DUF4012 domain-containing protein [Mycobacterium sp.]|nr:DUF4012 domain-containing protein [Mycobacterium sp.]
MRIFSRNPSNDQPNSDDDRSVHPDEDATVLSRIPGLRSRREAILSGVVLVLIVGAFAGWLALRVSETKSNLEDARSSAQQARDALLAGKGDDATTAAESATAHAHQARDAAHSVPWNIVSAIPWLGSPFKSGQQITDVVLGLATEVLQPAARAGAALSPDRLLQGNRVDVQLLREQEPALSAISADANRIDAQARAISDPAYLSAISEARTQLQSQTTQITKLLENTALAARIAPSMMGADGTRTYFMGFQTNAEARGTGGLLGGFGILRFDNGTATVDDLGTNTELNKPFKPIDLGQEFADNYGFTNPFTDYRNSNQSPHFPYAAQIWKAMWAQQSGNNVDGAIAIDPVALSYILGAVGPVTMRDGEVVTKDNVVELTESTAYSRFPTDQAARKQYLQDIANEVVKKMTGTKVQSPRNLLEALGRAVSERRIAVWSASPEDQKLLEETPLAHTIPDDAAPYAAVVVNNLGGNKMDYYLKRGIEYAADGCGDATRMSTVTVRLANAAPSSGLPDYVSTSAGLRSDIPIQVPPGTNLASVKLYGTKGAALVSVLSNGQKVPVITGEERGHPTFEVQVAIPPGTNGELSFRLSEPAAAGAPRVPVQPLLDPVTPVVSVPECPK